jgi:hypothetical protein
MAVLRQNESAVTNLVALIGTLAFLLASGRLQIPAGEKPIRDYLGLSQGSEAALIATLCVRNSKKCVAKTGWICKSHTS